MDTIITNYNAWMELDQNPQSVAFLRELFKEEKWQDLDKLLNNRLVFGTAGLRASMGPGFSQMNVITILQASQGLCHYLKEKTNRDSRPCVVIGHDHRFNSLEFANITACVFLLGGFDVHYLGPDICATPMVPFAVDLLKAQAGIMITASHNPKNDNGYKVYWNNGCQIIPPLDSEIQSSILKNLTPWEGFDWDIQRVLDSHSDALHYCRDDIVTKYIDHLKTKLLECTKTKISGFKAVYTAMHGVGTEFVDNLMNSIGSNDILINLQSQCSPDPNFPTVEFPNPEEKGALDLATEYADSINCPLVVANDPDADRFSFAVKHEGQWTQLTGNEIGTLFADFVISNYKNNNKDLSRVYLLNSTVSSQMLKSMAQIDGFNYTDTLTGFKWIGNKAIDLESEGYEVPFAYEEAIGFMFPTVHDKDGIAALLMFLQMYQWHASLKTTPLDRLQLLYSKYGYFKEFNGYYKTTQTNLIFEKFIRSKGIPKTIGQWEVVSWRDLTVGYDSITLDNVPLLPVDPHSQMITGVVVSGNQDKEEKVEVRFTLRGSGTEPKLKVYIEAKASNESIAQESARALWETLRTHYHLDYN